jgi:energy-coupling factor transport system substrate-specific component
VNVSPRLFALVPAAVAINLVVGRVVAELGLPVYLDTLGTMLVAVLAGLSGGLVVGTLAQLLSGMLGGYFWVAFTPIQWLIALLAATAARRAGFATPWRSVGWGMLCGLACGACSAPISYFLFGGVTSTGTTLVSAALETAGVPLSVAVTISSIGTDILDKAMAFLVVGMLLRALPRRILGRFPVAAQAVGQ